jgi:glycosyltransferase involved in cell wall biosynthesis
MISVIVPTHNRSVQLLTTLNSLVLLDFDPGAYEVIVVDNASTDDTRAVAEGFIARNGSHSLRYVYDAVPGLLTGRHKGAMEAKGELLSFVDDDIEADRGWLRAIDSAFRDPEVHLVGGKCLPKYEVDPPAWLSHFWKHDAAGDRCPWLSLIDLGEKIKFIDPIFVWGLNYSIRKKTLYDLGGFHPDNIPSRLQRFQGDGETGLSNKIKSSGLKALYHPGALVHHLISKERLTPEYFEKRAFYEGVCSSYSEIRRSGKLPGNPSSALRSLVGKGSRIALYFLRDWMRNRSESATFEEISARVREGFRRGYAFHQKAVRENPALLDWITRKDYFDYRLPGQGEGSAEPQRR